MHLGFRQDIADYKAQDIFGLTVLDQEKKYWILSRAEYVHDNTISPAINIFNGLRLKIYGEYFYQISKPNGGLYNVGTDIRYYPKIYKNIIGALRFAYAHSGGNKKINYILGGVDNWLLAKQNPFPPSQGENFGFQSLATNLRGYEQNARSGNSFGVVNAEIRAPILTPFIKKPIQSAFLKNLQAVAFIDAGNAWNGIIPSQDNLERNYIFPMNGLPNANPDVTVSLSPPNTGLAIGYGAGLRTMLFGYFIRADAGWNIEGRKRPIWHLSIGTDF